MIRIVFLFVLCCLSFVNANDSYAQKSYSPSTKCERTVFTEGDLVYVQNEHGFLLRLEAENMKGGGLSLGFHIEAESLRKLNSQELFRTIFSEERAKELENYRLLCVLHFNVETKKMEYVSFRWREEGEFPFKLSELKKIEDVFINYPYKIIPPLENYKQKGYVLWTFPVIFKKVYAN